jgi:hypothetical protein
MATECPHEKGPQCPHGPAGMCLICVGKRVVDEAWSLYTFSICCMVIVMIVSLIAGEIGG